MIQEAVKLNLDRDEAFVKTIEKYWESTLIRTLLDLKTEELKGEILITREEMEVYYLKNKDELGLPYEQVKGSIQSILESKHLEQKLKAWTEELRNSADITINQALVKGL
jgi:hypothetical protein